MRQHVRGIVLIAYDSLEYLELVRTSRTDLPRRYAVSDLLKDAVGKQRYNCNTQIIALGLELGERGLAQGTLARLHLLACIGLLGCLLRLLILGATPGDTMTMLRIHCDAADLARPIEPECAEK